MKTLEDLKRYYRSTLLPELTVLEDERKGIAQRLVGLGAIILGVVGGSEFLLFKSGISEPRVFFIAPLLGAAIWMMVYRFLTRDYTRQFKAEIIKKIVNFVDEHLTYIEDGYMAEPVFLASQIFKRTPDRYRGDDLVRGTIGETPIEFSEVHAEYKTETVDSRGHRHTHWHTIFKGLFFMADFNKRFTGRTVVLPDAAERLFGHIGELFQSWNVSRGQLVKLEDPEFEKRFVVYGDDQIEARYILSTSLMKRIVDFKEKSQRQIYLSFVESKICIAISYKENLFEPRVFRTLLDFAPIEDYFQHLELAVGIVDDLNLNTRIWGN